jgi:phage baseplate assembly protein V
MDNETRQEAGATLKFGTVSAIDVASGRARVRLDDCDNLRTAFLPVLQAKTAKDKHYHMPDVGEHVAVMLDGRGEDGVILGSFFSTADAAPAASVDKHLVRFADGAEVEYDRSSSAMRVVGVKTLLIDAATTVTVKAGTKVTIDCPETEATGNMLVRGLLTYQGGMSGSGGAGGYAALIDGAMKATGDVVAGSISAQNHRHGGVQSGGSKTDTPE